MRYLKKCGMVALGLMGGFLSAAAADVPAAEIQKELERLGGEEFSAREAAFERLLDLGVSSSEAVLAALPAESPDPDLRKRCDELRRRIPLEPLLRKTLASLGNNKKDKEVREAVIAFVDTPSPQTMSALTRISKGRKNLTELFEAFRNHEDPLLISDLLYALYYSNAESGVRFAMERRTDPDAHVRFIALGILVKGLGKKASPLLIKSLLEDPVRDNQLHVVTLLRDDLQDLSIAPDLRLFVRNQLIDRKQMDRDLVSYALRALAKMKDQESAPLFASLDDEFDLLVRATAVWGLGCLGDKRYAAQVARHLDSTEPFVQNAAACGLALLSGEPALAVACKGRFSMGLSGQPDGFIVQKKEDLVPGGDGEDMKNEIAAVRAWWEKHKGDPGYAQGH